MMLNLVSHGHLLKFVKILGLIKAITCDCVWCKLNSTLTDVLVQIAHQINCCPT